MFRPSIYQRTRTCRICQKVCKSRSGLTRHFAVHCDISPPPTPEHDTQEEPDFTYQRHPVLDGQPCTIGGEFIPRNSPAPSPPSPPGPADPEGWFPFEDRTAFDFAHYHFVEVQNSEENINRALDIWAASVWKLGGDVPWNNARELYATIDEIRVGSVPWKTYHLRYDGPLPEGTPPQWMIQTYELHARDSRLLLQRQLADPAFKSQTNYSAYRQYNPAGKRVYSNLMSADWAWQQSDKIAVDPQTRGCMFVPVVSGSDKTTVSVATGHQEYHPVYQSPGNITNSARRAHGPGVLPSAFLPIPKTSKKHRKTIAYQRFCRQLYHACLAAIFEPLKAGMAVPEVVKCADGHYRKVIYGIGPYIADYPEQVWLAGIVQGWCAKCDAEPSNLDDTPNTHLRSCTTRDFMVKVFDPGILWSDYGIRSDILPFTHKFPRADIHEIMAPDLLHQLIKGTFKDHLVDWVNTYLILVHGETGALAIVQDIDRRISAVPAFPGIRRFPEGRDFNQWTGDDSKALMKVYIAAIAGHVPSDMVKALSSFMECCYIARKNSLTVDDFDDFDRHLTNFHVHRQIFVRTAVRTDTSLPRQHSLKHYPHNFRLFGSPNGLCSSITESKHIKAVKEPWRRSNQFKALQQMLRTITRMEDMATMKTMFTKRGWMIGSTSSFSRMVLEDNIDEIVAAATIIGADDGTNDEDDDLGPVSVPRVESSIKLAAAKAPGYPSRLTPLSKYIQQPLFPELLRRFLYDQLHPDSPIPIQDVPLIECPDFTGRISVFHSAVARFFAPSDHCGAGGMYQERIRSNPAWHGDQNRRDTVLVVLDENEPGMHGMMVARVLLFFSFTFRHVYYPCALVNWYAHWGNEPDHETGMWVVVPEKGNQGRQRRRTIEIIHLDSVARSVHLLPIYGSAFLPEDLHFADALDAFQSFYVNKFADHHSYEFLSS